MEGLESVATALRGAGRARAAPAHRAAHHVQADESIARASRIEDLLARIKEGQPPADGEADD